MATNNNKNSPSTAASRPYKTTQPPPRPQPPLPYYAASMRAQTQPTISPPPPSQSQGILFPVATSGRGYIAKTVQSPGGYRSRPVVAATTPYSPHRPRPPSIGSPSHHIIRAQLLHHHPHIAPTTPISSPPIKGIPVAVHPKVASSPAESNGYKNIRDRGRDDNLFMVRDRKVRITEGSSLYALCRSWLKNGLPEENQLQRGENTKSLPRPPPLPAPEFAKEDESVEEDDEPQDKESVKHLSKQDLLKRHIMRAKKVRARLRGERLKRIARYKTRLALLIPPHGEQSKNDTAAGN